MNKEWVLCLVEPLDFPVDDIWDQSYWIDDGPHIKNVGKEKVTPLYDLPHSDKENGQKEKHYHVDTRYIEKIKDYTEIRIRLPIKSYQKLELRFLQKYREEECKKTSVSMIEKSKLKHKCIYKNKCPHRGFDLSGIEAVDGVITCPLHSLRFDAVTKKLLI